MSSKLNRNEILQEMLATLVKGWGRKAVYDALDALSGGIKEKDVAKGKRSTQTAHTEPKAVQLVEDLRMTGDRKALMLQIARAYDAGTAFPKISDVRAFLASHQHSAKDLRSRAQAFRSMIPILERMTEKGLLKLISRSHHSGPAELGEISDAIRNAGQDLRGSNVDDADDKN